MALKGGGDRTRITSCVAAARFLVLFFAQTQTFWWRERTLADGAPAVLWAAGRAADVAAAARLALRKNVSCGRRMVWQHSSYICCMVAAAGAISCYCGMNAWQRQRQNIWRAAVLLLGRYACWTAFSAGTPTFAGIQHRDLSLLKLRPL